MDVSVCRSVHSGAFQRLEIEDACIRCFQREGWLAEQLFTILSSTFLG